MHELVIRGGTVVDGTGAPPRTADVAIDGGRIAAIGDDVGTGHRVIDADGLLVAPGWVDVHTHYDGQALWDPVLSTSAGHGVTTVVMGNCGVGFAPVHAQHRDWTIQLMEGVEDIPAAVLDQGLGWRWETFPEYLDALDAVPHAIDIATQVPHAALRVFAMGERGIDHAEVPTDDEIAEMGRIAAEAIDAGALGFSTSRSRNHHATDGTLTPSLTATETELLGIVTAIGRGGRGVLEMVFEDGDDTVHLELARRMCEAGGRPLSLTTLQRPGPHGDHRRTLAALERANADGLRMRGQVAARPVGLLMSLGGSVHPLRPSPTFQQLARQFAGRSPDDLRAELERLEVRDRIVAELRGDADMTARFPYAYELGDPPRYDQGPDRTLAARAAARGITTAALAYDVVVAGGTIYVPVANFVDGTLDATHEMLVHPFTVPGLGDGGAHCTMIGDFDFPTFMLSYWGRDAPEAQRMPVEWVVARQAAATAELVGLGDRGRLLPGLRADVNLIELDALGSTAPRVVRDLPGNGARLVGHGTGYVATIVDGTVGHEHGEPTGAMPGALVRGDRPTGRQ
jgi:N-acyl-D-aspartate/D-glutamate deacylase